MDTLNNIGKSLLVPSFAVMLVHPIEVARCNYQTKINYKWPYQQVFNNIKILANIHPNNCDIYSKLDYVKNLNRILFPGLKWSLIAKTSFWSIKKNTYNYLKEQKKLDTMYASGISNVISSTLVNPLQVIRFRRETNQINDNFKKIIRNEGITKLWAGTLVANFYACGLLVQDPVNETLKSLNYSKFNSALVSSFVASLVFYPIMTINTRLKSGINPFKGNLYNGFLLDIPRNVLYRTIIFTLL